jgi:hypothetical protein
VTCAKNASDPSPDSCFCSDDLPDQWIAYQFANRKLTPVAYLIQSCNFIEGSIHPKSWVVEGSLDGKSWVELDRRTNVGDLNGPSAIVTFSVSNRRECSIVKLRQTGANHAGNNCFAFVYFDILTERPRLSFELRRSDPFNGIVGYLNRANRTVVVSGTPRSNAAEDAPSNATQFEDFEGRFWSANAPGQTLTYDFADRAVVVRAYAIRSAENKRVNLPYLRAWEIEISDDGAKWAVVDHREGVEALNGPAAVGTFTIAKPGQGRFVRIRQTGENHPGAEKGFENSLVVSAWEIYGDLIE